MNKASEIPGLDFLNVFTIVRDPHATLEELLKNIHTSHAVKSQLLPHTPYNIKNRPRGRIRIECYLMRVTVLSALDEIQKKIQKCGFFDLPLSATIEARMQAFYTFPLFFALGSAWVYVPENNDPKEKNIPHSFVPTVSSSWEVNIVELKCPGKELEKGSLFLMQSMEYPYFT